MYQRASDLVWVPASLISLCSAFSTHRPDQPTLTEVEQPVDAKEKHHGQTNHDEDHDRGQIRFLPGRPCDLGSFTTHFGEEAQKTFAMSRRVGESLGRVVRGFIFCVGHDIESVSRTCIIQLAGVEGLEPTAYGFGDRRSTS